MGERDLDARLDLRALAFFCGDLAAKRQPGALVLVVASRADYNGFTTDLVRSTRQQFPGHRVVYIEAANGPAVLRAIASQFQIAQERSYGYTIGPLRPTPGD